MRADEIITPKEVCELREAGFLIVQKPEVKTNTLPNRGTTVVVKSEVDGQFIEGMHIVSELEARHAQLNPVELAGQQATMRFLHGLAAKLGLLESAG